MAIAVKGRLNHILYASPAGYAVAEFAALDGLTNQDGEALKRFTGCGYGVTEGTEDLVYELTGDWKKNPKYGWQFNCKSAVVVADKTETGIKKFLVKCVKGIGPKTADAIYDCFGDETLDVLDKTPGNLSKVPGISKRKMLQIIDSYQSTKAISTIVTMLTPYGVDFSTCVQLHKEHGCGAIELIKKNPYKIADATKGIGFKTAEKIAEAIGFDMHSPYRIKAALLQTLKDAENGGDLFRKEGGGHLCVLFELWMKKADELLNSRFLQSGCYTDEVVSDREIWMCTTELFQEKEAYLFKGGLVSRAFVAKTEDRVAREVARLIRGNTEAYTENSVRQSVEDVSTSLGIQLADEQKQAAITCLLNPVCVITGGPGTGKSTILKVILAAFRLINPRCANDIQLCAPTGKAARRMTETTGFPASTLHSALGIHGEGEDNEREFPMLNAAFVVVDEVSMMDVYLTRQLLLAVQTGAKLLMVGDADQLPSIGPGAVLRDFIESGVIPVVKLRKIFRQAGGSPIIVNCRKVADGDAELTYCPEFCFVEKSEMRDAAEETARLFKEEVDRVGLDEVVVLTPFRHNTETGAEQMSKRLRDMINPSPVPSYLNRIYKRGEKEFRVGDKVMQTKNRVNVSNGDTGYVADIYTDADGVKTVKVSYGEYNFCTYTDANIDEIVLAYACTIHKSQGSEYKSVIVNIQNEHNAMLERNLLYTAISRSRDRVYIVGDKTAITKAINTQSSYHRLTLLAQRMREKAKTEIGPKQISINLN